LNVGRRISDYYETISLDINAKQLTRAPLRDRR
jgi:hypothetical protein